MLKIILIWNLIFNAAGIYLFKVNNRSTRTISEIYSKFDNKMPFNESFCFLFFLNSHVVKFWGLAEGVYFTSRNFSEHKLPGFSSKDFNTSWNQERVYRKNANNFQFTKFFPAKKSLEWLSWGFDTQISWIRTNGNNLRKDSCTFHIIHIIHHQLQ